MIDCWHLGDTWALMTSFEGEGHPCFKMSLTNYHHGDMTMKLPYEILHSPFVGERVLQKFLIRLGMFM